MQGRVGPRDPSRIILDSRPKGLQTPDGARRKGCARLSSGGVDSNYRYKIDKKQKHRKCRVIFPMHGVFLASGTPTGTARTRRSRKFVTPLSALAIASSGPGDNALRPAPHLHPSHMIASGHCAPFLSRLTGDRRQTGISRIILLSRHSIIPSTLRAIAIPTGRAIRYSIGRTRRLPKTLTFLRHRSARPRSADFRGHARWSAPSRRECRPLP